MQHKAILQGGAWRNRYTCIAGAKHYWPRRHCLNGVPQIPWKWYVYRWNFLFIPHLEHENFDHIQNLNLWLVASDPTTAWIFLFYAGLEDATSLYKRCIGVKIAGFVSHRCSLCWVSKVYIAECLRLSCLLVCVDSTFSRWGWSLCLVQILGVAERPGCRYCWRQSMMWTHR